MNTPQPPAASRWRLPLIVACCAAVTALAIAFGLHLRYQLWQSTESIRFAGDVQNAVHWGNRANEHGLFDIYDRLVERRTNGDYGLDYAPLRITIVTAWIGWTRTHIEHGDQWQNTYAFHKPMLWLNTACELAALPAVFLLVAGFLKKRWQCDWSDWKLPVAGLLAALLLWFNPAVLMEAHCWPQWDVWIVPFFLWALLAMWHDKPVAAGLLIGFSAMSKGQILLVAPLFVLWPLLAGRFKSAWGAAAGFVSGALLAALPFMLKQPAAWYWLIGVMSAVIVAPLLLAAIKHLPMRRSLRTTAAAMLCFAVAQTACWPVEVHAAVSNVALGCTIALGLAVALAMAFLPLRDIALSSVTAFALAVLLSVLLFDSSLAWFHVGTVYPTHHYNEMTMGPTANLPAILGYRYGWQINDLVATVGSYPLTIRDLLRIGYIFTLIPLAIAVARHARKCDVRFFFAVVTPWVLLFALLPQMHERYLLWAAACSVLFIGAGLGGLLLHLFLTAYAWAMIAVCMLNVANADVPKWRHFLNRLTPDAGWALLVIAAVLLYLSLTPGRPQPCIHRQPCPAADKLHRE